MPATAFFFEQLLGPRCLLLSGALPLLVGMGYAHSVHGGWSWPLALAALVAAVCGVQAGMMLDDLADHDGDALNDARVAGLSGGGGGLTGGRVSRRALWIVGSVAVALAGAAAIGIAIVRPATLWIAVAAFLIAILYSVGPRLVKRGVGDAVAFLSFGPLPILFGYTAIAGTVDVAALGLAVAFGAATVVGCMGMHLLDAGADAAVGKRTLVVRIGARRTVAAMATAQTLGLAAVAVLALVGQLPVVVLVAAVVLAPLAAASLWTIERGGRTREVRGETGLLVANTALHMTAAAALVAAVPGALPVVIAVVVLGGATIALQVEVFRRFRRTRRAAGVGVESVTVDHGQRVALVALDGRTTPVKARSRKRVETPRVPLLLHGVCLPGEQKHDTYIDLDVRAGEVVAVDAPEAVCDALQRVARGDAEPAAGSVRFMGRELATFRKRELEQLRRRYLGVVTALPFVDNTVDVRGNLEYVLLLRGLEAAEIRDAIDDAVTGLPLRDKLDHRFTDLTLSETRWFVLLRGLLMRPQLLLVEAGALDTSSDLAEKAAAHMRYHVAGTETGVLWTTTSVRAACSADRMFIYSLGNLVDADDQTSNAPYRLEL